MEILAIAEGVESTLDRMCRCSEREGLNIEAHLLKPSTIYASGCEGWLANSSAFFT